MREGIEAARRGDKIAARRLLQQVLITDKNNEIALMWMASVSDTLEDRRAYLRRALQINPNNERAREALSRLGETPPTPVAGGGSSGGSGNLRREALSAAPRPRGAATPNYYLLAAGIVGVAVVLVVVLTVVNRLTTQTPTNEVSNADAQATFAALLVATVTPTPTSRPPTATVFAGIVVTFNPNALGVDLPPTFTPTVTYTPQPTATAMPTGIPATAYEVVFSDFDPQVGRGNLYIGRIDAAPRQGQNEQAYDDVAYEPNSRRIAFVGPVYYPAEGDIPEAFAEEVFVAPLDDPYAVTQVTRLRAPQVTLPQWSPDGSRILFGANPYGNQELFIINADGSGVAQLTENDAIDAGARFRFDGLIVYASDAQSPGFTEIYTMNADGSNITRLSNHAGNSYAPAWSPDGTRIAYINDSMGDGDVYVMDADGQRPFMLTNDDSAAEDRLPTWSPDGRWIAFISNRDGDTFSWFATDLRGTVWQLNTSPDGRVPQTLNFIALRGE